MKTLFGFKTFTELQKFYLDANDGFACHVEGKGIWVWVKLYGGVIPRGTTEVRNIQGRTIEMH